MTRTGNVEIEGSVGVSMPIEAFQEAPKVLWNHIDGPLLWWAGRCHWLTPFERLAIWIGWSTVESVAQKHWPQRKRFAALRVIQGRDGE